jgi:hypothetical protein
MDYSTSSSNYCVNIFDYKDENDLAEVISTANFPDDLFFRRMRLRKCDSKFCSLYDTETIFKWLQRNPTHPETREHLGVYGLDRAKFKYGCLKKFCHVKNKDVTHEFCSKVLFDFLGNSSNIKKRELARAFLTVDTLRLIFIPDLDFGTTIEFLDTKPNGSWLLRASSLNLERNTNTFVFAVKKNFKTIQYRFLIVTGVGVFKLFGNSVPANMSSTSLLNCEILPFVCLLDALDAIHVSTKTSWKNVSLPSINAKGKNDMDDILSLNTLNMNVA